MRENAIDMLIVTPNGHVVDHTVPISEDKWRSAYAVLNSLCTQIGCETVEVVTLSSCIDLWIDGSDSARSKHQLNRIATYIAARSSHQHQQYFGVVILTGGPDAEGNTTTLSAQSKEYLYSLISEFGSSSQHGRDTER